MISVHIPTVVARPSARTGEKVSANQGSDGQRTHHPEHASCEQRDAQEPRDNRGSDPVHGHPRHGEAGERRGEAREQTGAVMIGRRAMRAPGVDRERRDEPDDRDQLPNLEQQRGEREGGTCPEESRPQHP